MYQRCVNIASLYGMTSEPVVLMIPEVTLVNLVVQKKRDYETQGEIRERGGSYDKPGKSAGITRREEGGWAFFT